MTRYAKHFGVYERVRCNTCVDSLAEVQVPGSSASSSTWILSVRTHDSRSQIHAARLIIATGLTNTPMLPSLPNSPAFAGPILHTRTLARDHAALTAPGIADVIVLGGSKSSIDAAYMLATARPGITAHLVIRDSGNGPAWLAKSYATPLKTPLEMLLMRRAVTCFGLPLWDDESVGYTWMRKLLHRTVIGRAVVDAFFAVIKSDMIAGMGLADHPETKKLMPSVDPFFTATSLGIDNYEGDLRELIREGRITVHTADIARLEADTVLLSSGEEVPANAIICATGWQERPNLTLEAPLTPKALGMPYYAIEKDALVARADAEIFARFPKLRSQPPQNPHASHNVTSNPSFHPFLLYKGMVPPAYLSQRNLAYAGFMACIAGPAMWHVQALWMTAFLDEALPVPLPEQGEVEYETVLYSRWSRWRGPQGPGAKHVECVFEALQYLDMLMRQLGLEWWRKGGVVRELVEAYESKDYAGVVEEWMRGRKGTSV